MLSVYNLFATLLVATIQQYLTLPASLKLARSFTFCNRAHGGSQEKKCENASVTKVIRSTFKA